MAVNKPKVVLPASHHPIAMVNGQPVFIDPVWYRSLKLLEELANATRNEVNTRHP